MTTRGVEQTMNRQHIDDNQIVERYLLGKLDTKEREAFEDFYVNDPELLDELDRVELLIATAAKLSDNADPIDVKKNDANPVVEKPTINSWKPFALAATLTAVALGATSLFQQSRIGDLEQNLSALALPQANPMIVDLLMDRSQSGFGQVDREITLTPHTPLVVFAIEAITSQSPQTATLRTKDGVVINSSLLYVDAQRLAYWSYSPSSLKPGEYVLELGPGSSQISSYRLLITLSP